MSTFKGVSNPQYSEFIALSRYCRWDKKKQRRETWSEVCDRVTNFWIKQHPKHEETIREVFDAQRNLELVGSMRANMTAGPALERDHVAGYNCSYTTMSGYGETLNLEHEKLDEPVVVHLKTPVDFDEMMYILMCFHPDTEVKTRRGDVKISKLKGTDEVLSFNNNGTYEWIVPSNIIETPSKDKAKIELELEDGSIIKCTADHKFLTTNRGWVEAQDLTEEDDIKNFNEVNKS